MEMSMPNLDVWLGAMDLRNGSGLLLSSHNVVHDFPLFEVPILDVEIIA